MSKKHTMSHTPEQRKAWHKGKKRSYETKAQWFWRISSKKIRGAAYTPRQLTKCIIYRSLK